MQKITGKSNGINWVHYYNFEFDGKICKLIDSYRLHKFDYGQGADKHPKDARYVRFVDFAGYTGYNHMNTHVIFEDNSEKYPMGEMYEQADKWSSIRLKQLMGGPFHTGSQSVAATVKADIERLHSSSYGGKFDHFGPMSKGCIY